MRCVRLEEERLPLRQRAEPAPAAWPPEVNLGRGDLRALRQKAVPVAIRHTDITAHAVIVLRFLRPCGQSAPFAMAISDWTRACRPPRGSDSAARAGAPGQGTHPRPRPQACDVQDH